MEAPLSARRMEGMFCEELLAGATETVGQTITPCLLA